MKKIFLVCMSLLAFMPAKGFAFGRHRKHNNPAPVATNPPVDLLSTAVSFGVATAAGSGCPNSVSSTLSPDNAKISVLFDPFAVQAGGADANFQRKDCTVSIPVQVPAGMQATVYGADYRGFNALTAGASSSLLLQYSLKDASGTQVGAAMNNSFNGPLTEDFIVTSSDVNFISGCGGAMTLKINMGLMINTNGAHDQVSSNVDSIDGNSKAGVGFHVALKRCVASSSSRRN